MNEPENNLNELVKEFQQRLSDHPAMKKDLLVSLTENNQHE
jgi:hypothetical protein